MVAEAADPGRMIPRVVALVFRQRGLITYQQALELSLSSDRVARLRRTGAWVRVRQGVYADAEVWAGLDDSVGRPLLRVRAAHLVLEVPHVFSHDSAALVHGMSLLRPVGELVHITRLDVRGDRTKAGIKPHGAAYSPDQVQVVDGLPCLDPARTAVDVTREHGLSVGVGACDHVLRAGGSRADLRAACAVMRCWPHVGIVREAVELADGGADNAAESASRVLVTELGVGRPETQFGLTDGGRTVWCDLRVGRHIFEFDGRVKYTPRGEGGVADGDPRAAVWKQKQRQDFICGFKLGVSRITYVDLFAERRLARARLSREYADTEARFGSAVDDLAPYIVRRHR